MENQSAELAEIISRQTGPVLVWIEHQRWRRHCIILKVLLQAQAQAIPFSLGETAVGDEEGMSDPEDGRYCSCLRKRMSSARTSRAPSRAVFFLTKCFQCSLCFVVVPSKETSFDSNSFNCSKTFNFTMSHQGPKGGVESDEIVRIASTSTFQTSPSSSSKDEQMSCIVTLPVQPNRSDQCSPFDVLLDLYS